MKPSKQNKNILRVALSLSVLLHLAGFYFLFPLELSSQENKKTLKVKVIYQQAKKLPAKKTLAPKPVPSQRMNKKESRPSPKAKLIKEISPTRPYQSYSPVRPKDHSPLAGKNSPASNVREPQPIGSFKSMSASQKIMRQEKVAKANTQISAKSPVNIEVSPQSAMHLQIASIRPQTVSRQIQSSTPSHIESHEALKMSIAYGKPGPVKEITHVQVKIPRSNSIGEVFRMAQVVHQTSKAVSARKEIRQTSPEEISPTSHQRASIKSSKSSAPGATSSLRHPAKQFPSPAKGKENAVSPQKTSGDISLKLARFFPAELRDQQNIIPGKPAEENHPGSAPSASLNPANEPHSNPFPGAAFEASEPLHRGENPSDFPGNDSGEVHRGFSAQVWDRIAEQKYYPRVARKRGYQGKPVVSFTIGETGDLRDLILLEASSHKILDEAALTAVKNASPYPRIPEALKLQSMQFKLPITFILDGP